jgi:hypothetical protein
MLRINAYITLYNYPDTPDRVLIDALNDLGRRAYREEMRHYLLPPVGGKIYLPVAAGGTLARLLGATARRLGMDGAYSATLGTWLVRLPPSRSYRVAGQLIDAIIALRLTPPGSVFPHHLTVQGDLGRGANLLSLLYLAASPILFAPRNSDDSGDERPFIMRGGGVLDRIDGRSRSKGARTDFIDGFLFVQKPDLAGIEHLTGHTINLRVKQVLAYGLLAEAGGKPPEAAAAYTRLRADLRAFLARYNLGTALDADWIDGRWSEIWPHLEHMSSIKEHDPSFLTTAQQLRDEALNTIEAIAIDGSRELWRGIPAQD